MEEFNWFGEIGKAFCFMLPDLFCIFFRKYKGVSPTEYRTDVLEKHHA